jgi:DNA-binding CsgD family transcriptional regulator
VILDTTVNARLQAALQQRLRVAEPSSLNSGTAEWMDVSRSFASAVSSSAVGSSAKDLLLAGFQALDLLGIGLVVCNASGQLLVANQTAEGILDSRDGLELDSDGVLCAVRPCNPSLQEHVQRAAGVWGEIESGANDIAVAVRRDSGRRALTLLIRTATGESTGSSQSMQAGALVLILDSATPSSTGEAELRQLYGLTSMETRLGQALMEGKSLDDCCNELGIRRTTGRMHLRNLFAKTGVRRQSELVSLLLKSIGLGPREK